jgi:hypothetical protein
VNLAAWGWSYVILGTILVGVGGSFATLGWNKIRAYDQFRSTIVGVARETALNGPMISEVADLAKRWPLRTKAELFSREFFHNAHSLAVSPQELWI